MHVMFKATDFCNMDCTYCYVSAEQRKDRSHFPVEHLHTILRKIFAWQQSYSSTDKLHFNWSGGEVLTLPISWWQEAFDIQKQCYEEGKHTFSYENGFQTNMTLMTDEYFEFLQKHNVSLGVTIDGTKECMDKTRRFWGGRSAFNVVMKKLNRLIDKYGHRPGVIIVLNRHNHEHIEEIYEFFKELGLGFQVNSYHYAPQSSFHDTENAITVDQYLEAMSRLFDLWSADAEVIEIANFRRAVDYLIAGRTSLCHHAKNCAEYFYTVRWDGGVYPCNEFGGEEFEKDYCYGNLITDEWESVRDNSSRAALLGRHLELENIEHAAGGCKGCRYWTGCYGGCLHSVMRGQHRSLRDRSPSQTAKLRDTEHCATTFGLYKYIETKLRESSKNNLLPILLYPDRVSNIPDEQRQAFYDYRGDVWVAESSQSDREPPSICEIFCDQAASIIGRQSQVLFVCAGHGDVMDYIAHNADSSNGALGMDYRYGATETAERMSRGGNPIELCNDVLRWKGWRQVRTWDSIFVDAGNIHDADMADLLFLCGQKIVSAGSMVVFMSLSELRSRNLLEITEYRGVKAYQHDAVAINAGDTSFAVLDALPWDRSERDPSVSEKLLTNER